MSARVGSPSLVLGPGEPALATRSTAARRLAVIAGPLVLLACSSAPIQPSATVSTRAPLIATQPDVRVTSIVDVACPAHDQEAPMALADVDADGHLDRVAVTHDDAGFTVHLHESPTLDETRAFHVDGDHIQIAVTQRGAGPRGDLWVIALHDQPAQQILFHLEGARLTEIWRGAGARSAPNLRLDLDGDGRVDPILGGALALREGTLDPIPGVRSALSIHGLPVGLGREEPVDLDGNGYPDVLAVEDGEVRILALPSFRSTFSRKASTAMILRFADRPAIYVGSDDGAEILASDEGHTLLARLPELRYATPLVRLDPAGDGSLLALAAWPSPALVSVAAPLDGPPSLLPTHHVLGMRAAPTSGERGDYLGAGPTPAQTKLDIDLATSADHAIARLGPVAVVAHGAPSLVGVRTVNRGSLSGFVTDGASYELVVRAPPGVGAGHVIGRGRLAGEGGASAELLDLDGDGAYEILLHESDLRAAEAVTGAEGSSRWFLLRGDGRVLWRDQGRTVTTAGGHFEDARATARALDLVGDGTLALQLRTADAEWYVLPASSKVPDRLPPCLE